MKNTFASFADWAPRFHLRVKECANTEMMDKMIGIFIKRLVLDLNRIAQSRIADASMEGNLQFSAYKASLKTIHVVPSDPLLFRKLEFGEFDENGVMKTPPHSIMAEWRVIIRP